MQEKRVKKIGPFPERLNVLIRERHLTHREIAEVAGVSKAAVGQWLSGTVPNAGAVFRIARAFDKPMEWFFEAIPDEPASEAEKAALLHTPERIPADKFRSAAQVVGLSSPQDMDRLIDLHLNYRQVWTPTAKGIEMHYEPIQPGAPGKESSNQVLTEISSTANLAGVKSPLAHLLERLNQATAARGRKAELAKYLKVPRPCVSDWLSGKREPSGGTALRLAQWVEKQERQQETLGSAGTTTKGKAQVHKSSYEKQTKVRKQR